MDLSYLTFGIVLILVWEFFKWINIEYNPAFKRWKKYSEDRVNEFIKKLKDELREGDFVDGESILCESPSTDEIVDKLAREMK